MTGLRGTLFPLGALLLILALRLSGSPVTAYGEDGAAWIEHIQRLELVLAWRDHGPTDLIEFVRSADDYFPPGLHLVTSVLTAPFGHSLASAVATGPLWLLLLGASAGHIAARLSPRPETFSIALAATALLPALHASSTRYYLDLPMTATLWLALALAVSTWDRKPVLGGLATAFTLLAACLVKWTALALAPFFLLAALLAPNQQGEADDVPSPISWKRRLTALSSAGFFFVLGLFLLLELLGPGSSLAVMGHEIGLLSDLARTEAGGINLLYQLASGILTAGDGLPEQSSIERLGWYLGGLIRHCFGPLAFLLYGSAGLLLIVSSIRDHRSGGRSIAPAMLPLATLLSGVLILQVFVIGVLDERFLLPLLPVFAIGAALGLASTELTPRHRTIGLSLAAVLLLLLAFDFHVAGLGLRQVGPGDSVEQRGWSSVSTARDPRLSLRKQLRAALRDCSVRVIREDDAPPEYSPLHEPIWHRYEARLAEIEDRAQTPQHLPLCEPPEATEDIAQALLWPSRVGEVGAPLDCVTDVTPALRWILPRGLPPLPVAPDDPATEHRGEPQITLAFKGVTAGCWHRATTNIR